MLKSDSARQLTIRERERLENAAFDATPSLDTPAQLTLGASGPVFGLIGALYHYGRTTSSGVKQMATSIMIQAVIFGMLGISELHRRNASLVHICWASALKAKLCRDDSADSEAARARIKPA